MSVCWQRVKADTAITPVDSSGRGARLRPSCSRIRPIATIPKPLPPCSSGTIKPCQPSSTKPSQSSFPVTTPWLSRRARKRLTGQVSASHSRALSWINFRLSVSSVMIFGNSTVSGRFRQALDPPGDDVDIDFRGPPLDGVAIAPQTRLHYVHHASCDVLVPTARPGATLDLDGQLPPLLFGFVGGHFV